MITVIFGLVSNDSSIAFEVAASTAEVSSSNKTIGNLRIKILAKAIR